MTDMTCPTCQTDEQTRIKQDARPTLLLTCDQCRTRWTVTVPDCGPGLHDWYDLTKTSSGRSPRQKCSVCGQTRVSPHA